mmetsp:Transcript_5923/g.14055  ORF Transcript_5923/g.14055 Transcript_5923/m.14055 type:complete len:91 (-) Transcript_5923:423-695(-)
MARLPLAQLGPEQAMMLPERVASKVVWLVPWNEPEVDLHRQTIPHQPEAPSPAPWGALSASPEANPRLLRRTALEWLASVRASEWASVQI